MLKSATGKAYLAYCGDAEREAILHNLRRSRLAEDARARDSRYVRELLATTRRNGYGEQYREILPKTAAIAVPIMREKRIVGCLNISFIASALKPSDAATRYLDPLIKGRVVEIALAVVTAVIGVFFMSVGLAGYLFRPLGIFARVVAGFAGLLLIPPPSDAFWTVLNVVGLLVGCALAAFEKFGLRPRFGV